MLDVDGLSDDFDFLDDPYNYKDVLRDGQPHCAVEAPDGRWFLVGIQWKFGGAPYLDLGRVIETTREAVEGMVAIDLDDYRPASDGTEERGGDP